MDKCEDNNYKRKGGTYCEECDIDGVHFWKDFPPITSGNFSFQKNEKILKYD